jgi:hypothetical protein
VAQLTKSPVSDASQLALWAPEPEPSPSPVPAPAAAVIMLVPQGIELPHGVKLIRYEPVEAPVRLSECAVVVDCAGFIRSTLHELNHRLHGNRFLDGGWGRQGLLDRLAAVGVEIKIDDPGKEP